MTQPLDAGEHDMPAPDNTPELIDGTGEDYGWPTLVRRQPPEPEVAHGPVA